MLATLLLLGPADTFAQSTGSETRHHRDEPRRKDGETGRVNAANSALTTGGETIVFFRHGEKPQPEGLGQLTCQGLNRAIRLPKALYTLFHSQFGKPAAIFAPNPGVQITDPHGPYNYVRPLATVAPTAILLGLPVNTQYGYADTDGLKKALLDPKYQSSLVYVAWEHDKMNALLKSWTGDPNVPQWSGSEYDMVVVLSINGGKVTWAEKKQGLNNLPTTCPDQ
ncbi:MAG: hypothetical protein U1E70_07685 [Acetobacteraceae bacterium]